jgi:RNA polymerase sigma-70 factor (ECF subfamily)
MPTGFRLFYETHVRFVWRALLRMGVLDDDVADAAQDVFFIVHRKLSEFEGRSKVTTWLFGICMRVASDRRKTAHTRRQIPSRCDPVLASEASVDATVLVDRRRACALLQSILDRMPEDQRVIFSLFELEEMDGNEIAELLELPVGTVRSRLRLAREAFRRSVSRLQAREGNDGAATLNVMETVR